jgi:hypothetical protein
VAVDNENLVSVRPDLADNLGDLSFLVFGGNDHGDAPASAGS